MNFSDLREQLTGELFTEEAIKRIYATDASAYREVPLAVVVPQNEEDIKTLIQFATENKTSLIPRAAGTSLAGQVVGGGIVVDVSKHFTEILEVNLEEGWAWVQPGIVRDELNRKLAKDGVFFAPETSTANRAMIGGMIGNNSCGANSIVYKSTREHLLEVKAILSNGEEVHFGATEELESENEFVNGLYENAKYILNNPDNIKRIEEQYPKSSIPRRNTGYAIDMLAQMQPFNKEGRLFNFCSLLAGSEGTLAFVTAAKIKLSALPLEHRRLVCIHNESIAQSLRANLVALKHRPSACELMDHFILEATERNIAQRANRFFLQGKPKAILVVELIRSSEDRVDEAVLAMLADLSKQGLGYAFPVIKGEDMAKVWDLRKAGLGLLSNVPGDDKPVPVIEDTAVDVQQLPEYIAEFNKLLESHGMYSVHYAHAGSGELHLRPIINLKREEGVKKFRLIAEEIAVLVKKYKGSLSGEHGDGRLRGEFIPQMIGKENYELLREIKKAWDPNNIFNPGKIVDTEPMDTSLRYEPNQVTPEFETMLDFSENQGILRSAELCNGSGDCRKSKLTGGTMCPSYQATRNEKDTTRARANILREFLTRSNHKNPFSHPEIKEVMDLCLSCKGCKTECPSNVDMAKLKSEWQYQSYQSNGAPFRARIVAGSAKGLRLMQYTPWMYNAFRNWTKPILGFAQERSIPKMASKTLRSWFRKSFRPLVKLPKSQVFFFFDEFSNYLDVEVGKAAIKLLDRLGYQVLEIPHKESGRAYLSKGFLKQAKSIAEKNVGEFHSLLGYGACLVGIEPSAILSFRDEYPDLLRGDAKKQALEVAKHTFTIEEFLSAELEAGRITSQNFTLDKKKILVHGHCHQKANSSMTFTKKILSAPENYDVEMIPSGCCGMAGSFGYEKEHYDTSMKIGELVLFPKVREADEETIIVAAGASCRHQIYDGTRRTAKHVVEVL
ncbi:MAG: FAD-binding protein [Cytophagales bacterium]|nr:FAD-binding protein [Cytophagales bacterium]